MKLSSLFFKILVVFPTPSQQLLDKFSYFTLLSFIKLGAYLRTVKFGHLIASKEKKRGKEKSVITKVDLHSDQGYINICNCL